MKYYVTIYIDPLIECFMDLKIHVIGKEKMLPTLFLSLTHAHPDELDSQSNIEIEKYSNLQSLYGGII